MPKFRRKTDYALGAKVSVNALSNQWIGQIILARYRQMAHVSMNIEFLSESAVVEWVRDMHGKEELGEWLCPVEEYQETQLQLAS